LEIASWSAALPTALAGLSLLPVTRTSEVCVVPEARTAVQRVPVEPTTGPHGWSYVEDVHK
jgi:hypothetical protein